MAWQVVNVEFFKSIIHSVAAMSYNEAQVWTVTITTNNKNDERTTVLKVLIKVFNNAAATTTNVTTQGDA
jgi:exoribonuclease R